jgi:hypothetical protein
MEEMDISNHGDFVFYTDYEKLETENEQLKARIAELEKKQVVWHTDMVNDLPTDDSECLLKVGEKKDVIQCCFDSANRWFLNCNGIIISNLYTSIIAWAELPKYTKEE